jgi:hypothetical protein
MTRLALVELATGTVVTVFPASRGRVAYPGGEVSPPVAGWRGGGALTYVPTLCDAGTRLPIEGEPENGQATIIRDIAETGPARYVIAPVKDGKVAAGRIATGAAPSFGYDAGAELVTETIPSKVYPLAEARAALVARVKADAHTRIVAICPEWRQRNLTARAVLLADKGRANWTADELAAWDAGRALWDRVAAIRTASDAIEAQIGAATTHGGAQAAYQAGEWPE